MNKVYCLLALGLILAGGLTLQGCGINKMMQDAMPTIAPTPPHSDQPFIDSSTPRQYTDINSGVIGEIPPFRFHGVICRAITPLMNTRYARHYKTEGGILPWTDQYGNKLFAIPQGQLSDWHNDLIHGK